MTDQHNPFTAHGADANRPPFMKYAKSIYTIGKERRLVENGTRFVANLETLETGHVKFSKNGAKPDRHMGRVVDGFRPDRNLLPDNDIQYWPTGMNGKPEDPYQETSEIHLANLETKEVVCFSTTSVGGRKALKLLAFAYGNEMHKRPNQWPIISLETGGYDGPRGWVDEPILKTVDWIDKGSDGALAIPAPAPKPAPALAKPVNLSDEPPPPDPSDYGVGPNDVPDDSWPD